MTSQVTSSPFPRPSLPVSRELAWQNPSPVCRAPDSGQPQCLQGTEGVARQVGAGVTSVAITSDFSLQPK